MKILLAIPEHLKTVPMGFYIYETLKKTGWDVEKVDLGGRKKTDLLLYPFYGGYKSLVNKRIIRLAKTKKPDIFFTVYGFDIFPETYDRLRQMGILRICWWLNDPFQFERSARISPFYDYFFTNAMGSVEKYKTIGIKKVFFLPTACHPPVHRKLDLSHDELKKYKSDICFAGDWNPVREELLLEVSKRFNLSIWGPWARKLSPSSPLRRHIRGKYFKPDEMVKIYNGAKIVLNIHTWYGRFNYGLNPRIFEAPACNAFTITDFKEEIPLLFDSEYIAFRSKDEMMELIAYYIDNQSRREDISMRLNTEVYSKHTYEIRIREIFSRIDKSYN
jgi:spore maturation protein CgeB